MKFGFSFQDVPGMRFEEIRILSIGPCIINTYFDRWNNSFFEVFTDRYELVRLRGTGFPPDLGLVREFTKVPAKLNRAAFILEIWNGNYAHWVAYHIPKLLAFSDFGLSGQVLLAEHPRLPAVEQETIEIFCSSQPLTQRLAEGSTLVNELMIIDGPPNHPELLKKTSLNARRRFPSINKRRRLFISRQNASWRRLRNEQQLFERLQGLGFEIVELEKLAFRDQILCFSEAEIVVGTHGAGLANMIFCDPSATIVEIVSRDFPCPDHFRTALSLGLRYSLLYGDSIGDANPGFRDMVVDIDDVCSRVERLMPK